ncbi:MAG: VPLPA-CTERM sorting domain-containing protein [Gammaproteobacteria bacterium]|nr:VPLPA-CTERM sorting domain-containing protein [Gammaproteobacteria bacterium]
MEFNKLVLNGLFKISVLPLMLTATLTVTQVQAASISYYLDQSNDLLDGVNYAQVTISDSITVAGDIDFTVEILDSAFTVSGDNFGLQSFSFNYDPSLSIDASNVVSSIWSVSEGKNAGGGFGKFGLQLSGNGSTRTDILNFSITGVAGDTIESYALASILSPSSDEFFAAHIAGFDETDGVTSAKFAGSTTVVPVPAAVWLFGTGLIGLVGVARRKA